MQLPKVLGDHGLETKGQYAQVQQILSSDYDIVDEPIVLLFENEQNRNKQTFQSYVVHSLAYVERIPGVDVAASPLTDLKMSKGNYAYALISIQGSTKDKKIAMEQIRNEIPNYPNFKVSMTGKPVVQEDVNRFSKHDLETAETIGVPLAFILLMITFGGILPALIPILAGGMTVVIAMGIMYVIGAFGDSSLSVFVYNVIPMVGMAVSIDFALLMVSRYREETAFQSVREAVIRTMKSSGRTVTISVVCVVLALMGTFMIRMPIFNSVALGAIVVLAIAALINLTFVPAILFKLGDRIATERKQKWPPDARGGWHAFISTVMNRPGISALIAIIVLIICLLPMQSMQMEIPGPESLPKDAESRISATTIADRFKPRMISQAYMIVNELSVDRIRGDLEQDSRVLRIDSAHSRVNKGQYLLTVWLKGKESSTEVMQWIRERDKRYGTMSVLIGGEPKYHQEVHDEIFNRIKYVLSYVALSNYIVLAWAFRSLLIPIKAIAMNLLSIGASLGIIAWIFQQGLWGMEPTPIAIMIPIFIFGLTFGISMDYGIFLLSRIYESYRHTRDNDMAVREGLANSGKIITSAAAIMIAVTAPFAFAGVTGVKQLGIGIAAALLIDATIIRLILVPSLMKLLGKWNWWFPFVRS
ncbi:MMPL family transporter [Cohnella yongneupensis]|uniref:MMPL family transporter n=1 Tax=Cohnella yongneupensis TaxID=425006 RepID=A0ABW0QWC9_9BACL